MPCGAARGGRTATILPQMNEILQLPSNLNQQGGGIGPRKVVSLLQAPCVLSQPEWWESDGLAVDQKGLTGGWQGVCSRFGRRVCLGWSYLPV